MDSSSGKQPGSGRRVAPSIDGVRRVTAAQHLGPVRKPKLDTMAHASFRAQVHKTYIPVTSGLAASPAAKQAPRRTAQSTSSPVLAPKHSQDTVGGASSAQQPYEVPDYQPPKRFKRILHRRITRKALIWRTAISACLVLLLVGGFLSWRAYANLHKIFRGHTTIAALSKAQAPEELKNEGDSRVNILLLGVGGPGHEGPDLTDTIVILSVDPVNNTAAMISIPRDLWVDMPVNYFGKQQKINAAYESGKYHLIGGLDATNRNEQAVEAGFDSVDKVIKQVMDVRIDYHMLVNFRAFKQAVDTVGGITVNVSTPLYDASIAWENKNNPLIAPAGVQQMDGAKALLYARSRKSSSDFARTDRQRQILIAIKDKVLTLGTLSNPAKIDGLMGAFGENVYSDLTTQGAVRLYDIMKKVGDSKIASVSLSQEGHKLVTTDRLGNIDIDRPVAGLGIYKDIQDYVHSQIPDGYLVKEKASVAVVGSTQAGADATANLLKSYGYVVTSAGVATGSINKTVLVDLSDGKKPYTKHYLEARFDTKAISSLPAEAGLTGSTAKFVIMVTK